MTGENNQSTSTPWYQGVEGVDNEMIGVFQNRGWDKLDPKLAAVQATKAFRSAETYVGHPTDQLIKLPKDANDAAAWNAVWTKLGKPADVKGYDLSAVKYKDGSGLSEGEQAYITATAHALNLSKDAGTRLATEMVKYRDGVAEGAAREKGAALAAEKEALAKNWGQNQAANMQVARNAIKALGLDNKDGQELVNTLEGVVGYSKILELFRNIGARLGEDRFIGGGGGGQGGEDKGAAHGVMTRDQAHAKIAELKKDTEWTKRYLSGGTAEKREFMELHRIAMGA